MKPPFNWRAAIPYGDGFVFVDAVLELQLPQRIVTSHEYREQGSLAGQHLVGGRGVVPGILLAEQAAQSALILGHASGWLKPGDVALLGRINCTFQSVVELPATVIAVVSAQVQGGGIAGFRADLRVGDSQVARIILAASNIGAPLA